jgi:hypothetical protein
MNKTGVTYFLVGVALTVFAFYPILKGLRREQRWGLLLSPEEVKATCGRPQVDDLYVLTYIDGDRRTELRFFGANHQMFLTNVKWSSSKGSGEIRQVSRGLISEYVKNGWLPACLDAAAR